MISRGHSQATRPTVSRISVVTVCLNCIDTISLTLNNVRSQTHPDVEHVVIDGGSVDGTAEVVRDFGVDYFVSEPDGGIYQAMEKGIAAATGDVLVFLNSADVFHDDRVAADIVQYFNETGASVVFGDFVPYLVNPDDSYEHPCFQADVVCSNATVTSRLCLRDRNIHHQAVCYHRDVFQTCSFFSEELPNGNDYELNAQALVRDAYRTFYMPRTVTRFALGGVTTSNAEKEASDYENVIEIIQSKYFPLTEEAPTYEYHFSRPTDATAATQAVHESSLWHRLGQRAKSLRTSVRSRVQKQIVRSSRDAAKAKERFIGASQRVAREFKQLIPSPKEQLSLLEKELVAQRSTIENTNQLLAELNGQLTSLRSQFSDYRACQNHLIEQFEHNSLVMQLTQSRLLENSLDAAGRHHPHERGYGLTSQFDEDGITQFLTRMIEVPDKTFVEFGVENYREANTRLLLQKENWRGLVIDNSEQGIRQIQKSDLYWRHNLQAKHAFVTPENINDLIASAGISGDIGLLSIDIDGVDYWVWEAISVVQPRIVICEYNSIFGMSARVTVPPEPDFDRSQQHYSWLYAGASLAALTDLASQKGYCLVASNNAGNNAFFVRNDVMGQLRPLSVEEAYVKAQFRESRNEAGQLSYLTIDEGIKLLGDLPVIDTESGNKVLIRDIHCQYKATEPLPAISVA